MKIVFANHEFRAHFPARIHHLDAFLRNTEHELVVLEVFGKSICYEFSDRNVGSCVWEILFPEATNGTISGRVLHEKISERLAFYNPDVIITGIPTFPVAVSCLRWARKNNKGVVSFGNAKYDTFPKWWLAHFVKKKLFELVDAFFCPTTDWDESMIKWGFKKNQLFYGLNVADNSFWRNEVTASPKFDNLPGSYWLTCGRQIEMKNLPWFLKAYLKYRALGGQMPLVMVGNGIEHDTLLKLARGVPDIHFISFVSHEEMKELFVRARTLFLPSFKPETWGIVANEAMAAGVPVAVSTECGVSSIIEHRKNGWLFSPYDDSALVTLFNELSDLDNGVFDAVKTSALRTIDEWDISRFSQGALASCMYAVSNKERSRDWISYVFLYLWKGRVTISNGKMK